MFSVGPGDGGRIEVRPQQALAGAGFLDLGNHRRLASGEAGSQGSGETARRRQGSSGLFQGRLAAQRPGGSHFFALYREDALQDVGGHGYVGPWASERVKRTKASSLAMAAPLLMVWRAAARPASWPGARPAA